VTWPQLSGFIGDKPTGLATGFHGTADIYQIERLNVPPARHSSPSSPSSSLLPIGQFVHSVFDDG